MVNVRFIIPFVYNMPAREFTLTAGQRHKMAAAKYAECNAILQFYD